MSNYFLEFPDKEYTGTTKWGDGKADKFIEIKSFSHSIEMPLSESAQVSSKQGRVHGRSKHEPIEVVRSLDAASVFFHRLCSGGLIAKEAAIHVYHNFTEGSSQANVEYFTIKMKDVIVAKVALSGSGDDLPEETVSLSYSSIQWEYHSPAVDNADKGAGGQKVAAWSLKTNTETF